MSRQFISIGGWCGPALALGKYGLRTTAFPFDFSRVTLDGIIHFTEHGFDNGFFPPGPRPYRPECVGQWVLFRGQHTAFAHFDLNNDEILTGFKRKFQRWNSALAGDLGPCTFLRTVTARNPIEELKLVHDFEHAVEKRNPTLDFRVAVAVHDQGMSETCMLAPMSPRVSLWALEYTEAADKSLFDRSQAGYATILSHCMDDSSWPLRDLPTVTLRRPGDERQVSSEWTTFPWRSHDNIALIDGVASVGGTCVGVGSTRCMQQGCMVCAACGNNDWHRAGRPTNPVRAFTDEEDELLLVHLYKIMTGGDKVEVVEQLANEMNRGVFEVICRLQFLTNSSTKITEGLGIYASWRDECDCSHQCSNVDISIAVQ